MEILDVFTGQLNRVADSYDELIRQANEQRWQEAFLFSELVYKLHQAGKAPGMGQCFAIVPHPTLGGPNPSNGDAIDLQLVMVMEMPVWQSICAQLLT